MPVNQALQTAQNIATQNQGFATQQMVHTRAMDAIHRIDEIRQEGEIARLKAELERATQAAQGSSGKPRVSEEAIYARQKMQGELDAARENNEVLLKAIKERDEIITEWMQSNETFKRLTRQYGKKLALTDEQRVVDYNETVLDLAEENPEYKDTKLTNVANGAKLAPKP